MATLEEIDAQIGVNAGPRLSVWNDRPPPAPADTAPPIVPSKLAIAEGANTANMTALMQSRLNRLTEALSPETRSSITIVETPRNEPASASAFQAAAERGQQYLTIEPPPIAMPGLPGMAQTPQSSLVTQKAGQVRIQGDIAAAQKVARQSGLAISDEGVVTVVPEGEKPGTAPPNEFARVKAPGSQSNQELLSRIDGGIPVAGSVESRQAAVPSFWVDDATAEKEPFTRSLGQRLSDIGAEMQADAQTAAALSVGVMKGIVNVPLGLAQASQLPDAIMRPIQDMYQGLSDQFEEVTGKRPVADFVGRLMGSTAAILVGTRALGSAPVQAVMPRAVTAAWEMLGPAGRTFATGLGIGATPFYTEGAERETRFGAEKFIPVRVIDSIGGGLFGGIGAIVAKGVNYAMSQVASMGTGQRFLPELERMTGGIVRNSEKPLNDTVAHMQKVEQTIAEKYSLSKANGQQFEGFVSGVGGKEGLAEGGFLQAIDDSLASHPAANVPLTKQAERVAARVKELLGIDKQQGQLDELIAMAERELPKLGPRFASQEEARKAAWAAERFQPEPIEAGKYEQAIKYLNDTWASTRGRAPKRQIKDIKKALEDVATAEAATYGLGREEFLRKFAAAQDYYKENYVPFQKLFGKQNSSQVLGQKLASGETAPFSGTTPATFFDKVMGIVEKRDTQMASDLAKMLGPQGRDNLKMMVAARALEKVSGAEVKGAVNYIKEHEVVLRELLGREEYTQLIGLGNIAQDVMKRFLTKEGQTETRRGGPWARSIAPILATYSLAHGNVGSAAATMAAMPAYVLAMRVLHGLNEQRLIRPLVRRAATMNPDSPEFANLMRVFERRVQAATAISARATQP